MLKYILFAFLTFNLYALEVSLLGAKENFQNYSILHLKNTNEFLCQEVKNNFDMPLKVVCAFSKQPSKKFKNIQNDFFKIESQIKDKTYFIIITPYKKIKLFPMIFDIRTDHTIFQADVKLSKHWMILGYKDELPYIKSEKKSDTAINFPYYQNRDNMPYVGSLDIKGNPVQIKKVKDVTDYLKIKQYYKDERYDLCLEVIDEIITEYPNSLFIAEMLFYKIKVFTKLKRYDELIDISKIYLKEYSSDENIPEVLSLTADAYSKIGRGSDADYFFDRLFSEHYDSPYSKWGYIYKAQMLEESGSSSKALGYYIKALQETDDIEIAATAAYSLVNYYMNNLNKKDAVTYAMKIINAKPSFYIKNFDNSVNIMKYFEEEGDYLTASEIAKALLNEMNKRDDYYELFLKDRAVWLSKTQNIEDAMEAVKAYLENYSDGEYIQEVEVARDSMFFQNKDANLTTKLENYNELIDKYRDESIGDKALYYKAKLFFQNSMFSELLDIKESLLGLDSELYKDVNKLINESAAGVMKEALKNKNCLTMLDIYNKYNITLSHEWDDGVYECSMKGSNFTLAKEISSKNLKSENLEDRKKWLYRYIQVDFRSGKYSDVIEPAKELITLIKDSDNIEYKDIYRTLFDTYQRLEDTKNMIKTIVDIQKVYGSDYKDIERYVAVMGIGSKNRDDNMIIDYANEVIKIQNASDSFVQSPYVEFTIYQAYINKENYNEALEVIKSLDRVELSKSQRSRQKYILGTIYEKLWRDDDAQKAYQEAIDADDSSAWSKLAKGAKNI